VLAHVGKEMRVHAVRLIPGDRVVLEISPRDRARGRIIERL
jgi:translation initiation factor IF-1